MKNKILILIGLIMCAVLIAACTEEQQPTVLPGNQINETPLVNESMNTTNVPIVNTTPAENLSQVKPSTGSGVSSNGTNTTYFNNQTTMYNVTNIINGLNGTNLTNNYTANYTNVTFTGNYSNNTNRT